MKKISLIVFSLVTSLLSSCSTKISTQENSSFLNSSSSVSNTSSSSSNITTNKNSTSSNPKIDDILNEFEGEIVYVNNAKDLDQEEFYNEFYNYKSDIEITLSFTNNSIYKLADYSDDDYKKDMYHPCDLIVKMNNIIYVFKEAGARMKGNTSRNNEFVDENGKFKAPVHFKVSVSQTFDDQEDNDYYINEWKNEDDRKERKKRRIGAAKKFDIKYNKNLDNTFTKQIYAYNCYENEGLIVQKNNLIKVNILSESDQMTHLYELQECIDSEFIERRYNEEEASGNLYKCTYSAKGPANLTTIKNNVIGIEKGDYHPVYDLKTNDDEPDHTLLENLINNLNNDTSSADNFKTSFDKMINADEFIKFAALSWVIGNPDDIRNNSNNYYMYFNSLTNKASFIPYDYDRCFGIMKDWPIEMQNIPYYTTKQNLGNRVWQPNPLFWRTIISEEDSSVNYSEKWPVIKEYQEQYKNLCIEYANKYLDVNKYKSFNNQFVYSNKNIEVGGADNLSFEAYAKAKLATFAN